MPDSLTSGTESDFVCDCEYWMRSACAEEPFFREYEGKRYCVFHFPGEEKSIEFNQALQRKLDVKDFNFRGVWFPNELTFSGFHFSGDADFRNATFSANADFVAATFDVQAYFDNAIFRADASFANVGFSGPAYFYSVSFRGETDFRSATFRASTEFRRAIFRAANFRYVTFQGYANFRSTSFSARADFSEAIFDTNADFNSAAFSAMADVSSAIFGGTANFMGARFSAVAFFRFATFKDYANFRKARFSAKADFSDATFADRVRFDQLVLGDSSSLALQFAKIEKPEHVSFHTLTLRPHWFVNTDARKFDFTNVGWQRGSINEEIESLRSQKILPSQRLLSIACRHLAVNAEDNNRYEEASTLRYMAMEAKRQERWRGLAILRLSWWYWLASGYGERVLRAFLVLLGIWFAAAFFYTHVGFARWEPKLASEADIVVAKKDDVGAPLRLSRALTYSAGVMTLQKPEPRPATTAAQTIVLLETILGPVQAALLALAIRRKFMR